MGNFKRGRIKIDIWTSAPTVSDLKIGEMVYCTADGKLYLKDTNSDLKSSAAFS